MKKNLLFIAAISMTVALASCAGGGETATEETTPEASVAEAITWRVEAAESNVRWEGGTAGAQVYSHFGTINIKDGMITTEGDMIKSGDFKIDMMSIAPQDENYSEEHPSSDLVGHLSSDDFFSIATYPTASFSIKSVDANGIVGDLTIKDKTNEETIKIENIQMNDNSMKVTGTMVFDRQKYGVAWAHYLKDVVLSDDITLNFTLLTKKG